jgi:hypothetical protein
MSKSSVPEITGGGDREGSAIRLEIAKERVEFTTERRRIFRVARSFTEKS